MKTWLIVREKSVKIEDILHVCSFRHKVRPCGHKTFEQSQHCIYNIHSVLIEFICSMIASILNPHQKYMEMITQIGLKQFFKIFIKIIPAKFGFIWLHGFKDED
jgi:phage-related protein